MNKLVQVVCDTKVKFDASFQQYDEADIAVNRFINKKVTNKSIMRLHDDIMRFCTVEREAFYDVLYYIETNGYIPSYMFACIEE